MENSLVTYGFNKDRERIEHLKVIPQKLKFPMNFFKTFPECSLPSTVSKKTIKMIGHHSRLRDMMGQSYPIYGCTRAI